MASSDFVIAVGRQFGSGGRSLAAELARRLGAEYYDKELLSEAAARMGYMPGIFTQADEKRPSLFRASIMHGLGMGGDPGIMSGEGLFTAQSEVLHEIADRGPCVIVGRAADYVLRDRPGLVSVFLHAPLMHRAANVMQRGDCSDITKAAEMARRQDQGREEFYNFFTGRRWGRADNYHLSLDTSRLPQQALADIIVAYMRGRGLAD